MWLKDFFVVKSLMGTPLEWKILLRSKNFQLHFRSKLNKSAKKYRSKLDIRYLGRMCFSSWSFLTHIKNPMGLKGFFGMESLLVGLKKVALNRLRLQKQVTWVKAVIARRGHWHKSPMGTVSPVSTPFLPGREGSEGRGGEGECPKKLLQIS